jgi:glutamine---fructose-6-phosphate transaminase (isomerizing)
MPSFGYQIAKRALRAKRVCIVSRFSSEVKHGPLSAVHDGYPVLFITAPGDEAMMINPVLSNRNEVTTRGGRANVHDFLVIPGADCLFAPILLALPAQLVAYYMSVARGIDPDFPRNLSKTLTVD